jgi:methenyltetrahydromethanopterin cyclohydrolase
LAARTASAAGTVQIVARSLETALHKLHTLNFDLSLVQGGFGIAPIPPPAKDDLTAIGWTNDAILYGGRVSLFVSADEKTIEEFGPRVPSSASPDYGRPFAEIFARYAGDFYKIDPMLFSPAEVSFSNFNFEPKKEKGMRFSWADFGFLQAEPLTTEMRFGSLAPNVLIESFAKK